MSESPVLHPSLDLLGGRLAGLEAGELFPLAGVDVRERAAFYARHGVLNIIDLDAAVGRGANAALVEDMCRRHECSVGGGLRTPEDALRWLRAGAQKVILGSAPFAAGGLDRSFLAALARRVPPAHVVFALDTRAGVITTGAWTRSTGLRAEEVVGELEPFCSEFVLTAIEREGGAAGPDLDAIKRLSARTRHHLQAAGGIATVAHIRALAVLGVSPVLSQVIHRGELDLTAAFLALADLDRAVTRLPTIVEDGAGRILAAFESSSESLARTLRTGECFAPPRAAGGLDPVTSAGRLVRAARVRVAGEPPRVLITSES